MKFLILVCAFVAVTYGEKIPPELKEKIELCLKKNEEREDFLETLKTHNRWEEMKCISACVLSELGVVDAKGKLIKEKVHKKAKEYGVKLRTDYMQIGDPDCLDKANEKTDVCDVAAEFHKCQFVKLYKDNSD